MQYGPLSFVNRPWVIGHRGASGHYPENTRPAFAAAINEGAHGFELDVQLTLDEELAVIHDDTLDRTTDGTGPVAEKTLAELQGLDAGGWLHPKFCKTRVPSLDEVLTRFETEKVLINVEIKPQQDPQLRRKTEERVARLLSGKRDITNLVVSAFDRRTLFQLQELCPRLALASLHDEMPTEREIDEIRQRVPNLAAFHLNAKKFSAGAFELPPNINIPILVWTTDNIASLGAFLKRGVSGFFTNYPKRFAAAAHLVEAGMR